MAESRFQYVIYIRTTREALWDALTLPELTRIYWVQCWHDTKWQKGANWDLILPDGRVGDSGEVLDAVHPSRIVLKWRNELLPDLRAEGYSRCMIQLDEVAEAVRLSITHLIEVTDSKMIAAVSTGWPMILSSLKSLLETGEALDETRLWPKGV